MSRKTHKEVGPKGRAFWEQILKEKQREGLSYSEAASRHGVSKSSLCGWGKKLQGALGLDDAMDFVNVVSPSSPPASFELRLASGCVLSIPTSVSVATMLEIVRGLSGNPTIA
jgi:transposase-like protein